MVSRQIPVLKVGGSIPSEVTFFFVIYYVNYGVRTITLKMNFVIDMFLLLIITLKKSIAIPGKLSKSFKFTNRKNIIKQLNTKGQLL